MLEQFWGIRGAEVTPLPGGMNSQTWVVDHQGSTYVLKRVPSAQIASLFAGCDNASRLAQAGLVTGRPVPTTDGRLVLSEQGVALLEHVAGRELGGETDEEQEWIAATLAAVHVAGRPDSGPRTGTFMVDWLSPQLPGVEAHPWLVPLIEAVRAETDHLNVTWSIVHADPSPQAFVHNDSTGVTGLIDWSEARRGPVLYDVASAVMYLGGTDGATVFLDTYRAQGPLGSEEMQLLDAFRRFRWAVQAAYFAVRLASHDLTGIADQAENEEGLDDARRGLAALGLHTN